MDRRRANRRITAIAVFFCVVCFVFAVRLLTLQIIRRSDYMPVNKDGHILRESVIRARRGDICDRNGKVIVTNQYKTDLVLDYYALPATVAEENESILALIKLCAEFGVEPDLGSDFPLCGSYPDLEYVAGDAAEAQKAGMISRYNRKKSISAKDLAKYLAGRYDLIGDNGKLVCSPEDALTIMRVRWNMTASGFYDTGVYTLASDISRELMTAISESNIRGGILDTVAQRSYNYPGYASHILGQLGRIYAEDWDEYRERGYSMDALVGISGCEKIFEDYLRGTDGILVTEYDDEGNIIAQYTKKEPTPGHDVWLTIDIDLQVAAEDGLVETIDYIRSTATGNLTGEDVSAGAFTMVDIKTGQTLAIASNPTYDLTMYNEIYTELAAKEVSPLTNRAINGLYAPGSTFKLGVALAALDEGVIKPDTLINTTGKYTYFSSYQPRCWYYISTGHSHGLIDVSEAIRVSCNCFFYEVGRRLGIDRMNKYCTLYGLGQPTGFELGGEAGILAGPAYRNENSLPAWQETDTIVAAIGQSENLFSPLQINMYIAALANGGSRYAPTLLYSVKEFYTGRELVATPAPSLLSSFEISENNRKLLLSAMRSVVTSSATLTSTFRKVNAQVGGKTGTAQVGTTKSENAVFAAVAPYNDPQVAAVCVIEQGHAGSNAARTVARVFEKYFQ